MTYRNDECFKRTAASYATAVAEMLAVSPMVKKRGNQWDEAYEPKVGWGADGRKNLIAVADDVSVNFAYLHEYGRPIFINRGHDCWLRVSVSRSFYYDEYEWELTRSAVPESVDEETGETMPARPEVPAYARPSKKRITLSAEMFRVSLSKWNKEKALEALTTLPEATRASFVAQVTEAGEEVRKWGVSMARIAEQAKELAGSP